MSDQHHALFKKMVHWPHVSRLSYGNINWFIKTSLIFCITSLSLVTEVLRSFVFLVRCWQHLPWGPVASLDTWWFLWVPSIPLWALWPTRVLPNGYNLHAEPSGGAGKMTHPQGNKECLGCQVSSSSSFPVFDLLLLFFWKVRKKKKKPRPSNIICGFV